MDYTDFERFNKDVHTGDSLPEATDKLNANLRRLLSLLPDGILDGGEVVEIPGTSRVTSEGVDFHFQGEHFHIDATSNFQVGTDDGIFYLYFDATALTIAKCVTLSEAQSKGTPAAKIEVSGGGNLTEDLYQVPGIPAPVPVAAECQFFQNVANGHDYSPIKIKIPVASVLGGVASIQVLITGAIGTPGSFIMPDLGVIHAQSAPMVYPALTPGPPVWTDFLLTPTTPLIDSQYYAIVLIRTPTTYPSVIMDLNCIWGGEVPSITGLDSMWWDGFSPWKQCVTPPYSQPVHFNFRLYSYLGGSYITRLEDRREIITTLTQDMADIKYDRVEDLEYFEDMTSSSHWTVTHNLDIFPDNEISSITCYDDSFQARVIMPNFIEMIDENTVGIDWGGVSRAGSVKIKK